MVLGKWPARIVQTISSGSTCGDGDILVDENGGRWRLLSDAESRHLSNGGSATCPAVVRTIRDGKIY